LRRVAQTRFWGYPTGTRLAAARSPRAGSRLNTPMCVALQID